MNQPKRASTIRPGLRDALPSLPPGHNLLDFSLQIDVFFAHLWTEPLCRDYLRESYAHLLVDNIEEDVPVAHDLIYSWLPHAESALVICDQDAGYRSFLGADPVSAAALHDLCDERMTFAESFVTSPEMQAFGDTLSRILQPGAASAPPAVQPPPDLKNVLRFESCRYHPDMLDWTADAIAALVHNDGVSPGESSSSRRSSPMRCASRHPPPGTTRRARAVAPAFARVARGTCHADPADVGGARASGLGRRPPKLRCGLRLDANHRRPRPGTRALAGGRALPGKRQNAVLGPLRRRQSRYAAAHHLPLRRALRGAALMWTPIAPEPRR